MNIGFRCKTDHDRGVTATITWLDEQGLIQPLASDDLKDVVEKSFAQ